MSPARALRTRPRLVYGPVPSRRLGLSLGVDLVPPKTCTFDCVYCQVGRTTRKTARRRDFVPVAEVLAQVRSALASGKKIDCVTLSGRGEPTLYRSLEAVIRGIKKLSGLPVAVLTNASLLYRKAVRRGLAAADIVIPTFDAADQAVLDRVNRPLAAIGFGRILRGLKAFRKEFPGRIWIEVMLVKGLNDAPAQLRQLRPLIEALGPDRVQLNTVVRPPAEKSARPLDRKELERAAALLGPGTEILADFRKRSRADPASLGAEDVLAVLKRRPVTLRDLTLSLGRPASEVRMRLASLVREGLARPVVHKGRRYFEPA
jgi:wyosine [tRNA(Phe)-imidazoG37] synthetase (radical SAM superfamily)